MATTKDYEQKKSLARSLFMSGMELTEISDKVGVSRNTLSKWCAACGWKESRAAKNITRPELVNKLLLSIDALLEQTNAVQDPAQMAGLADKLAKFAAVIEKLDKKANIIDAIEVFKAFSSWLEFRAQTDPSITLELIKQGNHLQDMFIVESFNKGGVI